MRAAIWVHQHAAAACWPLLLLLLLDGPALVLAGSKVACDYSNRLCQWNATYAVGGAVLGDLAFYHGGLYANDATVPVNGSHLDVLDLRTLSPYTMQVEFNPGLQSSRYKHFLLPWDNQLLAVGGQVDDDNGKSVKEMSIIMLDLNTRTWSSLKIFDITEDKEVHMLFDAVAVSGDYLLASVTVYDPAQPRRLYLTMDLNTAAVDGNTPLLEGAPQILDWPLVAITSLTADGSTPHLVLQAKRQMPPVKELQGVMQWSVMTDTGGSPAKQVTASTPLKQQQGGSGGKVLAVNILQVGGKPKLVLLAATSARFSSSPQPQNVATVVVFDIDASSSSSRVALQLSSVLLTPPLGWALKGITSLDLPLLGNVAAQERDLGLLPYVGAVDTIGTLDASNAVIQPAPGGFVIRGSGLADQSCQPGATWQPFVFKATFGQQQPAGAVLINPSVVALSNYTWCSTRRQQIVAAHITNSGAALETNTGLFRVDSPSGTQLMLLNAQPLESAGGQFKFPNKKAPLMGAFINLNTSSVANFTISTPDGYIYPKGLASCMTRLQGRPVYVETGGTEYDVDRNEDTLSKGVYVMDATVSAAQHSLLAAAGAGGAAPGFVHSALACTPDGQLFLFGGLRNGGRRALNPGGDAKTSWEPTNSLTVLRLSGSPSSPSVSKDFEVSSSSTSPQPAARSGQAMAYLPPSVASSLGLSQGGLVMYGGSNIPATLQDHLLDAKATEVAAKLRGTQWDTTTWLFDVATRKWVQLATQGAGPPGLMYHSMTAAGQQVVVWGGQAFNTSGPRVRLSSMMYVLDFASRPPRWRQAHIRLNNQGAFQFDFPSSGLVILPEFGAVAVKHRSAVNLAPIPQSLEFRGSEADILSRWGLNTLNTTAGDWLRLAPSQPTLKLQQPLLVAADVLVSGVVPAAGGSNNRGSTTGRRLQQQQQQQSSQLQLVCDADKQPGSAVQIRAGGAELSQVDISGCAGTAVDVRVDATGAYTSPARLTNVTLRRNRGVQGAALYVGPSAAATLQAVTIAGNTGPEGVVFAAQRSSLTLTNCSLTGNNGTAVVFAGSSLTVQGSSFTGNTATGSLGTVSAPAPAAARSSKSGGALRLLCFEPGPGGYDSVVVVSNSSFSSNRGVHGGALYAGRGTTLRLTGVVCANNSGYDGGALFVDRDACVEAMVNSSFTNNNATARGGAVKMHNPSCSSLSWSGGVFSGNSAGDGGALYLTEITTRTINGSATYTHNTATRSPASRGAGTGGSGGTGGAIYLGLWGSEVLLHNSTFTNNRAMQLGGAVHALAIDSSSIRLHRVNATGNSAALQSPGLSDEEAVASMLRSEGGALHVDGSVARVIVSDSTLTGNMAGRGGAVSANTQGGSVLIDNSTISSNTALTAGGGVSVTERKSVTVTRSTLAGNTLVWQELAAGGGLYCFLCERVNITSSTFDGNRAAYGGGAAILQPWQASVVTNTSFTHNVALPDPLSELGTAADRRRRRSLLVESPVPLTGTFSGSRAVIPTRVGGQAAAVAILGPLAANVTGDSGSYTGGGGLYVSLSSSVRLEQCAFLSNTAFNGGGFLARTDACRPASNSSSGGSGSGSGSKCQLQLSRVSVRNNTASAAGGALITNIRPEVVTLSECNSGSALSRATLACLEARNSLMQSLETDGRHQQHSSGRSLLQDTADCSSSGHCVDSHSRHLGGGRFLLQQPGSSSSGDASAGAPSNEAVSGYGDFLLTSAASVKCQNLLRLGGGEELWQDDDCSLPIRAPPGQPFGRSFVLLDGLGDPIADGIYDSRMPMAAVAQATPGSVPYRIFGNTTQAQNGTARFTGLTVNGKPGDTVTLLFSTQNGLTLSRQVVLRRCQAGEYTDNSTSAPNELSYSCRPCQSPQFSFYPAATACSQCAALPVNSWAVCNEAALVPADGFYQSHPRSSVLSRCISSLACRRSDATRRQMATWAYTAANLSTAQMNSSVVAPYMDSMCAQGYTGPLCGACEPMYGHTGTTCVKCLASGANSFLYFLVCCFMLVVPAVQMVLHAKGVNRNTQLLAAATAAGGKLSWTQSRAGSAGPVGPNMLPPLAEGGSEEQQQHQQVAEERPAAANGAAVEMANMHTLYVCPSAAVAAGAASQHLPSSPPRQPPLPPVRVESVSQSDIDFFRVDQDSATAAAAGPDMYSPFSEASAVAGAIATRDGSGTSFAPSLSDANMSHMVGPRSGVPNARGGSLLLRLFDTNSVDHQAAAAWGYARAGSIQSPRGTRQPAPVSAQGSVHRRSYKFWHADILSMLINYMQLLGLLRLVRINWAEQLSKMLVYLDFTSGASTWVSVECSLDPYSTIPRSVARSIVVLLWPLVALLAVGAFWAAAAFLLRHRPWARRRLFFRRWLRTHVVMCVVILLYFLYTTTTRELVSLFSCSQVDDPLQLPHEVAGHNNPLYAEALSTLTYMSSGWSQGFWTSDTHIRCGSPAHVGLAVGLGVPGVLLFALGLPIGLAVYLTRIARATTPDGHSRLEDPEVELQFGSVYEKYRYGCYFWECLILLEAFTLTLLLVMLASQNNAALQVLVAMAVIFVEAVLHITFQPYACRLLDTLRRLAVYGLMSTCFMLMLVTLSEAQDHDRLLAACMIIVALINTGVIAVHLWACGREVKRWLLWTAGKGPNERLTWADVLAAVPEGVRDSKLVQRISQQPLLRNNRWAKHRSQRRQQSGARRGDMETVPEAEGGSRSLTAAGDQADEQGPGREGVTVVINPTSAQQRPTPGWVDNHQPHASGGNPHT